MRKKDYLVCVDSDGCAMDTMNCKHELCFGPALIQVWGLEARQQEIQNCWNRVNLFSETRGINRFLALAMVMEEKGQGSDLDGFADFKRWIEETGELSAASLKLWMEQEEGMDSQFCRRAYQWTLLVNQKIDQLTVSGKQSFGGVLEALREIHKKADIAVVSSANRAAVEAEWSREGLLEYVDVLMTQENGSKADCIQKLLEAGYPVNQVLMAGDAPGDLKAAGKNQVLFYPILANQEEASWRRLKETVMNCFLEGRYEGQMEQEQKNAFYQNLKILSES